MQLMHYEILHRWNTQKYIGIIMDSAQVRKFDWIWLQIIGHEMSLEHHSAYYMISLCVIMNQYSENEKT